MTGYAQHLTSSRQTEQARRDQVKNNAGGYTFALDKWGQLERFLILGAAGGTYYVGERELTRENAKVVEECLAEDPHRTLERIMQISDAGRAPKSDPAIFALAMATSSPNEVARKLGYHAIPTVCRIGTHLFKWAGDHKALGGNTQGRAFRSNVANWYNSRSPEKLAYQTIKYQQREGWSHADLLRLSHPSPKTGSHDAIYRWATKGIDGFLADTERLEHLPLQIVAFEDVKRAETVEQVVALIRDYRLPHECVPNEWKNHKEVWEALLEDMGASAMLRNLGKMTSIGLLQPLSKAAQKVRDTLGDKHVLEMARVHPMAVLIAMKTYGQGHGDKGKLTWQPVRQIMDTLDDAFYLAFEAVQPTGKAHLLALDVSSSMTSPCIGSPLSCREASAAMAMVIARSEPNYAVVGFTAPGARGRPGGGYGGQWGGGELGITEIDVSPKMRLDEVIRRIEALPMGGTDCALPMVFAKRNKLSIDVFVTVTDNETYAGSIHPHEALRQYRQDSGINAKSAVIGCTATRFTIADPNDAGSIDVVGFDSSVPAILADFARGELGKTEVLR